MLLESYCSEANNKTCFSQCCYFGNSFKMAHGWNMHALSLEALMNLSNSSTLTERQTSLIVQTASQSYDCSDFTGRGHEWLETF